MAGKDNDENFAGIFHGIHSQEVTPEVCESGDAAEQEEEAVASCKYTCKDLQQMFFFAFLKGTPAIAGR